MRSSFKLAPESSHASVGFFAPTHLAQRLDPVLEHAVTQERIVGSVVLAARHGKVVYERAIGYADRESKRSLSSDALFRLASLTKPIVSVATLALVEKGVLALADPVTRWLPDFRPALADGRVPTLTVWHLLTHTAGLGYGLFYEELDLYRRAMISNGIDLPGLTFAENAARLASVPLFDEPGTAFRYSLATDVLGELIARAANSSLPALLNELVTGPLGMTDTAFQAIDRERLAVPYCDGSPPRRMLASDRIEFPGGAFDFAPERMFVPESYPSGGGGLTGTANDYLKFLEAIRVEDSRLLGRASFAQLKRDQVGDVRRPTPVPGDGWGFGFGFAVLISAQQAQSPLTVGSYRWEGVYGNTFWVDPQEQLCVVALTNTAMEGMFGDFPGQVQRAVYGKAPS